MKEIYYSHNSLDFYKYNAKYKQKHNEVIIRKYTFDSTQMVDEHVLATNFTIHKPSNLIIFNNLTMDIIYKIFKEEVIYHNIVDMLPKIVTAVKEERLDSRYEPIQDIIDEYPELFV